MTGGEWLIIWHAIAFLHVSGYFQPSIYITLFFFSILLLILSSFYNDYTSQEVPFHFVESRETWTQTFFETSIETIHIKEVLFSSSIAYCNFNNSIKHDKRYALISILSQPIAECLLSRPETLFLVLSKVRQIHF